MKETKGITLPTLVITVVVLVILATVTINSVDNGDIIKYAKDANKELELIQINEEIRTVIKRKNTDIKFSPNKYKNFENPDEFFINLFEVLTKDFIIDKEYVTYYENFTMINYIKVMHDPERYQQIDDVSAELRIPCIYKDYPVDVIIKITIEEIEDGVLLGVKEFDLSFSNNVSLAQGSSQHNVFKNEYIVDITDEGIPIPKGLYYVSGTKDTGVIVSTVENDSEENPTGAQFVWVPVLVNPKFKIIINSPEDKIETVQVLNTEGLDETYEVNSISFYKEYDITANGAFQVVVKYASGKIYDKVVIVDQFYDKQSETLTNLKAGIEAGINEEFPTVDIYLESMLQQEDIPYSTKMELLIAIINDDKAKNADITEEIAEKESVQKYGGFYIGRFEQNSSTVSCERAIAEINAVNTNFKDFGVTATLPSGVAWDRIGIWLTETSKSYYDVYIDSGTWGHYYGDSASSVKYYVNNIYKLAGGYAEWTTEVKDGINIIRGGSKESKGALTFYKRDTTISGSTGYRMLLYIK